MSKGKNDYHLYINGQAVPVSEEVYRTYKHFERKEEYFTYDLKAEKFSKKTASFLPSREDSYERLLETNQQFVVQEVSVQVQVENLLNVELVKKALSFLDPEERELINLPVLSGKNRTGGRDTTPYLPASGEQKKASSTDKIKKTSERIL